MGTKSFFKQYVVYLCLLYNMERILFYEREHKYIWGDAPLKSVSAFVDHFREDYNEQYYLDRGALKTLIPNLPELKKQWRYLGKLIMSNDFIEYLLLQVDPEDFFIARERLAAEWKSENKKSLIKGNAYHLAREAESYKRGYEINPFDGEKYVVYPKDKFRDADNHSLIECLADLPDGYYPELLLFPYKMQWEGEPLYLVGQSDRVFIGTDSLGRYADWDDYKSNKKITSTPFVNEDTFRPNTFLAPIEHIPDTKFHGYELQVGTYAFLGETHGLRVRNTAFTHINQMYKTQYRKTDIENMLRVWKQQNQPKWMKETTNI